MGIPDMSTLDTVLNEEKTLAKVHINADLSASELDKLLRKLALLRADMTPAVPATREELEHADMAVLTEDKPGLIIRALKAGGFRLWLRHRGFGWLTYEIDQRSAVTLADYVTSFTIDAKTVPSLIRDDLGNTH